MVDRMVNYALSDYSHVLLYLQFNLQKEGYDISTVQNVYYLDRSSQIYTRLTHGELKANL